MDALLRARYLSLATFRKNGDAVATPVWFAEEGGRLYVFTAGDSGKVKRLRNGSRARVAPCTVRGQRLGEWREARATIVTDPQTIDRAYRALRAKYGLQMWLTDAASRLTGRYAKRAVIGVEVLGAEDTAAGEVGTGARPPSDGRAR
jgi:PPOX class probable F420-dependent enzyme